MYDVADAAEATTGFADEAAQGFGFRFGGLARPLRKEGGGEGVPPVCKHLLACVLAERCARFFGMRAEGGDGGGREEGRGVAECAVNEIVLAGWTAGAGFG